MHLVRSLGLHKPDETPCGQPVSVAEAHALLEIAREPGISQNGLAGRLKLEKSTVSRRLPSHNPFRRLNLRGSQKQPLADL